MNFIRRLKRGDFHLQPTVLKVGGSLGGWKFAINLNISAQYLQNYTS